MHNALNMPRHYLGLSSPLTCLLAGASMGLCYAPINASWLIFALLLPLIATCQLPDANARILRGGLFGIGYFCLGSYWFAQTLIVQLDYSLPAALGGHLIITGACALAPAVFCWLGGYIRSGAVISESMTKSLFLIALWVLIEEIRFQAFGGGPWLSLALSQIDSPIRGFIPVFGETGTSSIILLLTLLFYHFVNGLSGSPFKSVTKASAICLVFITGALLDQIQWTEPKGDKVTVALVQTAVSQKEKANLHTQDERLADLVSHSLPFAGKVQLIVWPETVVTYAKHKLNRVLSEFNQTTLENKSTLLLGAYEKTYYGTLLNTAYTLGYEGEQSYSKRHLVPFGEYVPAWLWFMDDVVPGDQRRKLGQETSLIANSGALFGVSICWEGAFSRDNNPLVRAGAQALINIANEAWFAHSSLPEQNLVAMQLRALETGRPALRVANFGPSAIIDHNGRITQQFGADRPGGISGEIQPMQGITPFVFIGADFIMLSAFAVCCLIAIQQWRSNTYLAERPSITYQEMTLATILLIVLVSIAIPRFSNLTSAPAETTSNSQPTNLELVSH